MAEFNKLLDLAEQMEQAKNSAFDELTDQIKKLAEALKMEAEDVVRELDTRLGASTAKGKQASKKTKATEGNADKEPLYKDSETGDTWSGRGKPPKWLQEKLDAGKQKVDYLNPNHQKYEENRVKLS